LQKRIQQAVRAISQISASKSPHVKARLPAAYEELLERTQQLLERAKSLVILGENEPFSLTAKGRAKQLDHWLSLVKQVCDTAQRRVVLKEQVPNADKLFSLFETHTQLYRRGKAGEPNQFGRLVLVFEDAAGFISHYHLMDRDAQDAEVIVEQTRAAQKRHGGEIERASFDRGFYAPENAEELAKILSHPCLPPRHPQQFAEQTANASVEFHRSRQRHPGIESAIGALQSGNGLKRCRDHSELGLARYLGLAVLGRNLHVLGKLLIARRDADAAAAFSKRKAA
jgi:IS5 family transposase